VILNSIAFGNFMRMRGNSTRIFPPPQLFRRRMEETCGLAQVCDQGLERSRLGRRPWISPK
jgi:hypothetical protein